MDVPGDVGKDGSERRAGRMYQHVSTAPDGATVLVSSAVEFSYGFNFAVSAILSDFGSVRFGVLSNRDLADFEQVMRYELLPGVVVADIREVTLRAGRLATADVAMPQPVGLPAVVSRWAAWEGASGCLTTSRKNASHEDLVALFTGTPFHEGSAAPGIVLDAPIDNSIRPISGATMVPSIGLLELQPRVGDVESVIPSSPGVQVSGGELFRTGRDSQSLLLVAESAIAYVRPVHASPQQAVDYASSLTVAWRAAE
jgi:hypothetical protein